MLHSAEDGQFFDSAAGERARTAIAMAEQKLPGEALELLAKDVVNNLARRCASVIPTVAPPPSEEIDTLCDALIASDPDAALDLVLEFRARGTTTEGIYLGYVAGAARRLGVRWEEDQASLVDVSIGASRLYIIMRAMRPQLLAGAPKRGDISPALFASVPGETHTLGVSMAADLFRSRGWEIELLTGLDHDELVEAAGYDRYAVIGLSASSQRTTLALTRLITSLRVASPLSSILVSGELATIEPDLGALVDADSVAVDAAAAVGEMRRLLDATLAASG
jgi:methanogenic corrinoid protein MtbC1